MHSALGPRGLALSDRLGLLSFNVGLLKSCNAGMDSIDSWSLWNERRLCVSWSVKIHEGCMRLTGFFGLCYTLRRNRKKKSADIPFHIRNTTQHSVPLTTT